MVTRPLPRIHFGGSEYVYSANTIRIVHILSEIPSIMILENTNQNSIVAKKAKDNPRSGRISIVANSIQHLKSYKVNKKQPDTHVSNLNHLSRKKIEKTQRTAFCFFNLFVRRNARQ